MSDTGAEYTLIIDTGTDDQLGPWSDFNKLLYYVIIGDMFMAFIPCRLSTYKNKDNNHYKAQTIATVKL